MDLMGNKLDVVISLSVRTAIQYPVLLLSQVSWAKNWYKWVLWVPIPVLPSGLMAHTVPALARTERLP